MDYLKLRKAIENSNLSVTKLFKKLGMSRNSFYYSIEKESLKVETLEKICKELGEPINNFFDIGLLNVAEPKEFYGKEKSSLELDLIATLKELNECRKENKALQAKLSK